MFPFQTRIVYSDIFSNGFFYIYLRVRGQNFTPFLSFLEKSRKFICTHEMYRNILGAKREISLEVFCSSPCNNLIILSINCSIWHTLVITFKNIKSYGGGGGG